MRYKISLHNHTSEDQVEGNKIGYNIYNLLDRAKFFGINCLAVTCHKKFVVKETHLAYAKKLGILLIAGVELSMRKMFFFCNDIVVLNCDSSVEEMNNFEQLRAYKSKHPECFIIAPHPTFDFRLSLGSKNLERYAELFDAIEHSWFYTESIDFNLPAKNKAQQLGKPFIATADAHVLDYLNSDYALVDADELSCQAIFSSIRQGRLTNVTKAKPLFELIRYYFGMFFKGWLYRPIVPPNL